jgi:hypothetical protein
MKKAYDFAIDPKSTHEKKHTTLLSILVSFVRCLLCFVYCPLILESLHSRIDVVASNESFGHSVEREDSSGGSVWRLLIRTYVYLLAGPYVRNGSKRKE